MSTVHHTNEGARSNERELYRQYCASDYPSGSKGYREFMVDLATTLQAENKALREAAQAVVDNKWWHHGTRCVREEDLTALAALTKEDL